MIYGTEGFKGGPHLVHYYDERHNFLGQPISLRKTDFHFLTNKTDSTLAFNSKKLCFPSNELNNSEQKSIGKWSDENYCQAGNCSGGNSRKSELHRWKMF